MFLNFKTYGKVFFKLSNTQEDALLYAVPAQPLSTLLPLEDPPLLIIITNSTVLIVIIIVSECKPLILLDIMVYFRVSMWYYCPFMWLKRPQKIPKNRRIATLFFSTPCNHWIKSLAKQSHLRHNRPYKLHIQPRQGAKGLNIMENKRSTLTTWGFDMFFSSVMWRSGCFFGGHHGGMMKERKGQFLAGMHTIRNRQGNWQALNLYTYPNW